jgi:hypothetical protein
MHGPLLGGAFFSLDASSTRWMGVTGDDRSLAGIGVQRFRTHLSRLVFLGRKYTEAIIRTFV